MLSGALTTLPLPDLLQWADNSRVCGRLVVRQGGTELSVRLLDRQLMAVAAPGAAQIQAQELKSPRRRLLAADVLATERVLDAFLDPDGEFTLHPVSEEEPLLPQEVSVRLPLMWLVMEGMRMRDEWPRVSALFSDATARIRRTALTPGEPLGLAATALLAIAQQGPTVGEAGPALGLSRPAALRHLDKLLEAGLVLVDGAQPGRDPVREVLRQIDALLAEEQFSEAAHVVDALLAVDALDERLRAIKQSIQARQRRGLLFRLGEDTVFVRRPTAGEQAGLDAHVLALVDGQTTVAGLLQRSSLRDVPTLEGLDRLEQRGLIERR